MDALDAGLRDVLDRMLDCMATSEQVCRSHANKVYKVLENQKQAVDEMVQIAKRQGDRICERLNQAGERHQAEAKELRQELGQLKETIDTASAEHQENANALAAKHQETATALLAKMENLAQQAVDTIEQHEALDQKAQEKLERMAKLGEELGRKAKLAEIDICQLQTVAFPMQQKRLILRSRAPNLRASSMPAILREAQEIAKSRSPKSRSPTREQVQPATAAAQAVEPARGRSPAEIQAGSALAQAAAEALAMTRAATVYQ